MHGIDVVGRGLVGTGPAGHDDRLVEADVAALVGARRERFGDRAMMFGGGIVAPPENGGPSRHERPPRMMWVVERTCLADAGHAAPSGSPGSMACRAWWKKRRVRGPGKRSAHG